MRDADKKVFPGQGTISNKHVVADIWVVKASELGLNDNYIHTRTHLGHLLKPGDSVLGYNLEDANINDVNFEKLKQDVIPDIILVKKYYQDRNERIWKLQHLPQDIVLDKTERDYNDFLEELEEDPHMRQNVNIYKDKTKSMPVDTNDMEDPMAPVITLEEMLDDLVIDDVEMGGVGDDDDDM